MIQKYASFPIDAAIPLPDRLYYSFLMSAIESARYRVWASIFIVNVSLDEDLDGRVRSVIQLLAYKRALGLSVRIVTGDSNSTPAIRESSETARAYLESKNIPSRRYTQQGSKKSVHEKYVIIDHDLLVLGSHNWSPTALGGENKEDSIALYSRALNHELERRFVATWVDR